MCVFILWDAQFAASFSVVFKHLLMRHSLVNHTTMSNSFTSFDFFGWWCSGVCRWCAATTITQYFLSQTKVDVCTVVYYLPVDSFLSKNLVDIYWIFFFLQRNVKSFMSCFKVSSPLCPTCPPTKNVVSTLWCDSAVVTAWFGLGTKKDLIRFRGRSWRGLGPCQG